VVSLEVEQAAMQVTTLQEEISLLRGMMDSVKHEAAARCSMMLAEIKRTARTGHKKK
jgi:prefoldin subunit 5